jgi:hypothetical protein
MEKHKPISCLAILLSPEVPENRLWVIAGPQHSANLKGATSCNERVSDSFHDGKKSFLIINQSNPTNTYMQSIMRHSGEANLILRYFTNQNFTN